MRDDTTPAPHDAEAERAVLGAILFDPDAMGKCVSAGLKDSDFFKNGHPAIYGAAQALFDARRPIDGLTVASELGERRELESLVGLTQDGRPVTGFAYLSSLMDGVPKSSHVEAYAQIVMEKCFKRNLIAIGECAWNGIPTNELAERVILAEAEFKRMSGKRLPQGVDLLKVEPERARFTVENLIREKGLHLIWGAPSAGKTYTLLRWCAELLQKDPGFNLSEHPDLPIRASWTRVLWIATEESASGLSFKYRRVLRGMGNPELRGEIEYLFASGTERQIDLMDVPKLVDRHQPLDAIVLDSLTGLRPRLLDGQPVKWDLDNDAANVICKMLRGLAEARNLAIMLIHHTGRDTEKGYRGPTDWWASADVMLGLMPKDGHLKVVVEKNRDGRRVEPFQLIQTWGDDSFDLAYGGSAPMASLTPTEQEVLTCLAQATRASKSELGKLSNHSQRTITSAISKGIAAGLCFDTGIRVNNSPVIQSGPDSQAV